MNNVQSIISSFKLQDKLNPNVWSVKNGKYTMKPNIRYNLLEIAYDFIDSLKVDVIFSDIIMTGSLANFNWSKYSDVDLHIIVDYNQFPKNTRELYDELFRMKKTIYSTKHDITIYGYDVELYVEDENVPRDTKNVGRYSILNNEWVTYPSKDKININYKNVKEKSKQWMKIIDGVLENIEDEDVEAAKKIIQKYRTKLRKFRQCGLDKGGEYSEENLVFKILRRNGYLEKLKGSKNKLIDKKFTIKEATTTIGGTFKTDLENGPRHHGARAFGNWQSDNAWDIFAPAGTVVNSYTDGVVTRIKESGKNRGKVYGTQVSIKGDSKYPDIFYTHLKNVNLKSGDVVKVGDYIGEISEWLDGPNMTHVHIGLPRGRHLRELLTYSNMSKIFSGQKTSMSKEKIESVTTKILNPVSSTNISSPFGKRWGGMHWGVDIAVPSGTKVVSPANGVVTVSDSDSKGCGGTVTIDHGNGFKTRYCHLKKIDVNVNDVVNKGDDIGLSGGDKSDYGRGNSTGPHLHFETYENNNPVDPEPYLKGSNLITTIETPDSYNDNSEKTTNDASNKFFSKEDLINLIKGSFGQIFQNNMVK